MTEPAPELQESANSNVEAKAEPTEVVNLRSCLTRNLPYTEFVDRPKNLVYSCSEEQFGKERETRINEWNKLYTPFIEPIKLRNHRRLATLNPHFWLIPKSKQKAKRDLFVRLGVIELSLQNGLGSRYRLIPPPEQTFDFPMKCVAKVLLGKQCYAGRLREEACMEVVRNWHRYKWEVKLSYSIHMDFFRKYKPSGSNTEIHERAKYLYKVAVFEQMYECKRVELGAACNLYKTNFYCIECFPEENDRFRVIPTPTNFDKSVYFFAKEVAYNRKIVDRKNELYDNFFLIWLDPVIKAGRNLIMKDSIMKITYSNPDIGYFHLFEEDPLDPIEKFNATNDVKRIRYHFVQYCPTVYALHYYQRRGCRPWQSLMEGFGLWYETEVDERILTYDRLLIDRFHFLEKEFYRITEMSHKGFPISKDQYTNHTKQVEEFLSHLKTRTEKHYKRPTYRAEEMKKMYIDKMKRKRIRKLAISHKARLNNPHKHRLDPNVPIVSPLKRKIARYKFIDGKRQPKRKK